MKDKLRDYADRLERGEPWMHKGAKFTKWIKEVVSDMRNDADKIDADMMRDHVESAVPDGWCEFVERVSTQRPSKPDHWSSCDQCERNASDAEDLLAASPASPAGVPDGALTGKYAEVLLPFLGMMERELHANSGKGDRPGWLSMTRQMALLEIYYHVSKLQKAAKDNDLAGVREYSADVANMAMMLADVCGVLTAARSRESRDDLPGMWSNADFTGGDPDERCHAARVSEDEQSR